MLKVISVAIDDGAKIRATTKVDGKSRQRTAPFNGSVSWDAMHGEVAGRLLASLDLDIDPNVVQHKKFSDHYHTFWVEN